MSMYNVCFICQFIDGLKTLHADQMFLTTAEDKGEVLDTVKHV